MSNGSGPQPYAYTHPPVAQTALQPAGPAGPFLGQLTSPPSGRELGGRGLTPVMAVTTGSSDVTSFLMTETRQQNTEIRLCVGKVADKVDQLTSRVCARWGSAVHEGVAPCPGPLGLTLTLTRGQVEELQKQASLSAGVSSMPMETAIILHNIQRMVQVQPKENPEPPLSCSGVQQVAGADLVSLIGRRTSV